MKNLAILFLLLATPTQANTLTLICTGKTYPHEGGEIDMTPVTAVLDLDKLTFRPPWTGELIYSINRVTETEISFSVDNEMIHGAGSLDRATGLVDYSTTWKPGTGYPPLPDRSLGVCKPARPLF